ncbi:MAG: polyphosphate kinase 2 family protein [Gemmatimonadales bacterium]
MKIDTTPFRIVPGDPVDLEQRPTRIAPPHADDAEYERELAERVGKISRLQRDLYADNRHALLVVFQAMDAAGKDGAIRHVFSGVNPQGCQVAAFKQPSAEELDHDFLWRTVRHLPERGRIGIFNRSYYEEVLVVRVHPQYLDGQRLPDVPRDLGALWSARYRSIRDHEAHLGRNGTTVIKFYLHLSPDEQRERFLARLDDPDKNWKFSGGDVEERAHWPAYRQAYAEAIRETSTDEAPWFVVPADDKRTARLIVAEAVKDTLAALTLVRPSADPEELAAYRARLAPADQG